VVEWGWVIIAALGIFCGMLVGGSILLGIGAVIFIGSFWAAEVGWPLKVSGLVPSFTGIALIASYLVLRPKKQGIRGSGRCLSSRSVI